MNPPAADAPAGPAGPDAVGASAPRPSPSAPTTRSTPSVPATRWPAVLAALAAGIAIGLNVGKVPLALPSLREAFGLTLVQAGYVSSTLSTLAVFTAVGFGWLASRIGALSLVLAGLLAGSAASILALGAGGFAPLVATRIVEGAGFLAVAVAGPTLISAATAARDRRFALGAWATYMPAGAGSAMALSPLLMAWGGWRAVWALAALALAAAAAAVWSQRRWYASAPAQPAGSAGGEPTRAASAFAVLRQPLPWLLAFAFGMWAVQHFALIVWLPTFLKEERAMADGPVAALTALMLLANVPGNLIGGALVQRGASRGLLVAVAHVGTGLCAMGLAQDSWPDALRYALCVALSFIGGLIPSSVMSSSTLLARTPGQIGVLQGLIMQCTQMGQFIGTPLIAAVVAASGQWSSARWVTGAVALIGLALGLAAMRLEPRQPAARG